MTLKLCWSLPWHRSNLDLVFYGHWPWPRPCTCCR